VKNISPYERKFAQEITATLLEHVFVTDSLSVQFPFVICPALQWSEYDRMMGDARFLKRGFWTSRLEGAATLVALIELKVAEVLYFQTSVTT